MFGGAERASLAYIGITQWTTKAIRMEIFNDPVRTVFFIK